MLSLAFLGIEKATDKLGIGFVSGIAGFLRRNIFRVEAVAVIGLVITGVMAIFASPAAAAIGGNMMFALQAIPTNAANYGALNAFGNIYMASIVNGLNGIYMSAVAFFGPILQGAGWGGQAALNTATVATTATNTTAAVATHTAATTAATHGVVGHTAAAHAALQLAPVPPMDAHTLAAYNLHQHIVGLGR